MKLGFLTGSITDIEKAARFGFRGIELHVSPFGNPATGPLNEEAISQARHLAQTHNIEITALAYYDLPSPLPSPEQTLTAYVHVCAAAEMLNVRTIASLAGFDGSRNWEENLQIFAERFTPVAALAEQRGLRIAFENWMGLGGHLPFRPRNLGGSPDTWDAMFRVVPSPALGLEFDPSHLYWQGIDHIRALWEFRARVFHVHAKDTEMLPEQRYRYGINGNIFRFRIPGYGEIDWTRFISTLDEIGYQGGVAIEHEDPVYSRERFDEGLLRGWQVLQPLISPSTNAE